jgi:transcription termination factor NusA
MSCLLIATKGVLMDESSEIPSQALQRALHIDAALADKLVAGKLTCVEEVAYVPFSELLQVSGLPDMQATALRQIAKLYLLNESTDGLH